MNSNIFREYDIRGIVPTDLGKKGAFTIGQSYASYIDDKTVIVAYDNRLSSPMIYKHLVKGLKKCGAHVINLGLCTTPMYYIIKNHLQIKNGIMITASHNPKEYNGFKISFEHYGPTFGEGIYNFRDFTLKGDFTKGRGSVETFTDTEKLYLETIKNAVSLGPRKIKAVFDPGNGTSAVIIHKVLQMFEGQIEYKIINGESDGNFPVHHPDPSVAENMVQLQQEVKAGGFDLGIGIDGDGDRLGVVDNEGNLVPADKLMIILYKYLLPTMENKKAVMDVKCSKAVIDEMHKLNIPLEVYRSGASYMNHKIKTGGYSFGGEFAGHIWFNDKWPGVDDGLYASLRVIEMLSHISVDIATLAAQLPIYYNTPEIKVAVKEEEKDYIIDKIKEHLTSQNIQFNDIDGIRIDYPDGFALIRKSNTTPNLTLRFEKRDPAELETIQTEFTSLINQHITKEHNESSEH